MADGKNEPLRRLFDKALDLPAGARMAFLDSKCGGDDALKHRLLAMLAAADDEHFLAQPTGPAAAPPAAVAPLREAPGTHIGPYKLLQQIGEGGFGVVFLAEQSEPVARRVALKVIKLGMDTRQVVARFEQERQALAMMDHPNIAKVLDAGATATGRPYFVMEYVKGDPIVEYCDKNNLTIDERLGLFAQVCTAVQHAHGKGIIHRDLKPSNVLVGSQDGVPHAKVIDFGIAKAMHQKLTDKTLFTEHQQVIGTLQYMSPEQAAGSLDIDTRTDVYSLGVLLYELLTGSTPFDTKTLKHAMQAEVHRLIREVEPPKPSTRLHESQDTLASIAAHRRVEPRRLGSLVRGELDWIVMKALEKDRARRYETANGLAMDVRRYLAGEAVQAAPPGASYRLRKFVRRNRGAVAAVAAVAGTLLVGVVAFVWQADVARDERDSAVKAQRAEAEQRAQAKARADELALVAEFQADMLRQIDPTVAGRLLTDDVMARFGAALPKFEVPEADRPAQVEAFRQQWNRVNATDVAKALLDRTLLQPAAAAIDAQFAAQPVVAAKLRQTLAVLHRELGLYEAALRLQQSALADRRRLLGDDHPDTMDSISDMALVLRCLGRLAEAEPLSREALERRRRVRGEDHADTLASCNNLGVLLQDLGRATEAEPFVRQALEGRRRHLGNDHPDSLSAFANLGFVLEGLGRLAEAESCYREVLAKRRAALGDDHPDTQVTRNNLGLLLQTQNKLAEAEPLLREAIASRQRVLGDDHPDVLVPRNNLGLLLEAQGKLDEAETCFREVLAARQRVFGDDHPHTLTSRNNLGFLLMAQDRLAEAEPILRAALAARLRVQAGNHPETLGAKNNLGMVLQAQDKLAEAEPLLRDVFENLAAVVGDDHPNTRSAHINLVALLDRQGKFAEAEPMAREALAKAARALGDEHPLTLAATCRLAKVCFAQGRFAEVVALLAPVLPMARTSYTGKRSYQLARELLRLGRSHAKLAKGAGEFAAAEKELLEAEAIFASDPGPNPADRRDCLQALVELYEVWHEAEPGAGHAAKAAPWRAKLASPK